MSDKVLTHPTAYIIKGYRIPVFTIPDDFPYAILFKKNSIEYELLCSNSPLTITTNDDGDYVIKTGSQQKFYYYNVKTDKNWRDGSLYNFASSYYMTNYQNPIWSTNKVVYPNGTVFTEASDAPFAIYEGETEPISESDFDLYSWTVGLVYGLADGLQLIDNSVFEDDDSYTEDDEENENDNQLWETLFEGEVTTTKSSTGSTISSTVAPFRDDPYFYLYDGIRITVDGVVSVFTSEESSVSNSPRVGNASLHNDTADDTGYDYLVWNQLFGLANKQNRLLFYSRTSGTYQVKIERALFEPVAYLYNGVRLPKLPDWNKEKYPYAMIGAKDTTVGVKYYLYVTDTEISFNATSLNLLPYGGYTASSWRTDVDLLVWEEVHQDIENAKWSFDTKYGLTWSSFDAYRNGVLYCEKSDPIPVYE